MSRVKKIVLGGGGGRILTDTIKVPDLRTKPERIANASDETKMIPYLRTTNLKNQTLSCGTYLYSLYI